MTTQLSPAPSNEDVVSFGLHHRGSIREDDQDYVLWWGSDEIDPTEYHPDECLVSRGGSPFLSPTRFFLIADGMGGLEDGASAARLACTAAMASFRELARGHN